MVGVEQKSNAVLWEAEHVEHADDGLSCFRVQVRDAFRTVYVRGEIHKIGSLFVLSQSSHGSMRVRWAFRLEIVH